MTQLVRQLVLGKGEERPSDLGIYSCPSCKGPLDLRDEALGCRACSLSYPIVDGIPDFILEDLTQSGNLVFRAVPQLDWFAPIYEATLTCPFVLSLYGGAGTPSFDDIVRTVVGMVDMEKGLILDVACGPGTLGRRSASPAKAVYGIDVSMGMLRQGARYVARDHIPNVHFARARAEALPFDDRLFDAALCGFALHWFADPVLALSEIGRTMKARAPLAVTTLIAGDKGLLQFRRVREHLRENHGIHVFGLPELEHDLVEAGFDGFQPQVYGSILLGSARKRGDPP